MDLRYIKVLRNSLPQLQPRTCYYSFRETMQAFHRVLTALYKSQEKTMTYDTEQQYDRQPSQEDTRWQNDAREVSNSKSKRKKMKIRLCPGNLAGASGLVCRDGGDQAGPVDPGGEEVRRTGGQAGLPVQVRGGGGPGAQHAVLCRLHRHQQQLSRHLLRRGGEPRPGRQVNRAAAMQ